MCQCTFGTCWRCYAYSIQASVPYSTYSTYSMELGKSEGSAACLIAHIAHIAWTRSWGRVLVILQRVAQLCVFGQGGLTSRQGCSGGLATICTRSVGLALKRPRCRELLAVVQDPQTLRHGDRLVGPVAHRVLHSNSSSMRSGGRIFAMSSNVVEFRQVLHRDDPERLRRHLHVVVATFDGGWQVGRQSEKMLQRVHSPALGADVAAADLKLVQEQRPLVTQVALDRGSQHVRAGHHDELVQARGVFPLPLSP